MNRKESVLILGMLVLVFGTFSSARATLTDNLYLPASSHYQGQTNFSTQTGAGTGIAGKIEFAVYDTSAYPDEWGGAIGGHDVPGDGRYIYAYQIFVDNVSTDPLAYFAVMGIGENAITATDGIGSEDDFYSPSGIDCDDSRFEEDAAGSTMAVWRFTQGLLIGDERSYILVYSSDHDWKAGTYSVVAPDGEVPVANPEPATIALLGIGGLMLRRRKMAA